MEGRRFHKNSDSDTVTRGPKGKPTISMAAGFDIGFGGDVRILGFGFKTHAHSILTRMWLMR